VTSLHWLRVPGRMQYKFAVLSYKVLHGSAPRYLGTFTRVGDLHVQCTWPTVSTLCWRQSFGHAVCPTVYRGLSGVSSCLSLDLNHFAWIHRHSNEPELTRSIIVWNCFWGIKRYNYHRQRYLERFVDRPARQVLDDGNDGVCDSSCEADVTGPHAVSTEPITVASITASSLPWTWLPCCCPATRTSYKHETEQQRLMTLNWCVKNISK